jgi:hypothetical protein
MPYLHPRKHIEVQGVVQGVGFRPCTRFCALRRDNRLISQETPGRAANLARQDKPEIGPNLSLV